MPADNGQTNGAEPKRVSRRRHAQPGDAMPVLLTAQQVADLLQVHVKTVYAWKDDPEIGLPCIYLGSAVRFDRSEVLAWARARRKERRYAQA